jgi:pimeloyl-ACP methyl ester carboxylesterase
MLRTPVARKSFVRAQGDRLVDRIARFALGINAPPHAVALNLDVECGTLHARRFGSPWGRLAVGIPGLGTSSRSFDFLGERLGGRERQLVALDLRGRGASSRTPPGTYGWRRHAADVLAAAAMLQGPPCDLVGHSMGAFVAMQAVVRAPHRVRRVVLIDGVGVPDALALMVLFAGDRWSSWPLRASEVGVERADRWAVLEDTAHAATRRPRALWDALAIPVLLVRATRPLTRAGGFVVTDAERAAFVRAVPHAEVVEVDADHLGVMTHPDCAAAIRRFVS